MKRTSYFLDYALISAIDTLNSYASNMRVISEQGQLDAIIDENGFVNESIALIPNFEDEIIDAQKLRGVNGTLVVGGLGVVNFSKKQGNKPQSNLLAKIKPPKEVKPLDIFIRDGLVLYGYGDINLNLLRPLKYLMIVNHVGDININLPKSLQDNSVERVTLGWSAPNTKINITGINNISNLEMICNKADIRLPDTVSADFVNIEGNFYPMRLPIQRASAINIELNEYGTYLRDLREVTNILRIYHNKMHERSSGYPRGAYVDLNSLKKCNNMQCMYNDYVNIKNLEECSTQFICRNEKVYSDIFKDQFCTKPVKQELEQQENDIRTYYNEIHL